MSDKSTNPTFHILLVEDNPGDVYLIRQALKAADVEFELTLIEDGAEAISLVQSDGKYVGVPLPSLVVLDLNLPKRGGTEVLEAIRRNDAWLDVPVAVVSSSASPREQARIHALGVDRYILKPSDLDGFLEIGQMLKELLERKTSRTKTAAP